MCSYELHVVYNQVPIILCVYSSSMFHTLIQQYLTLCLHICLTYNCECDNALHLGATTYRVAAIISVDSLVGSVADRVDHAVVLQLSDGCLHRSWWYVTQSLPPPHILHYPVLWYPQMSCPFNNYTWIVNQSVVCVDLLGCCSLCSM